MALNLRGDLKKLCDAKLSARLEQCWRTYDSAEASAVPHKLRWSARCPVRHPSAYPIYSFVCFSGPIYAQAGMAFGFYLLATVSEKFGALLRMHLLLCEAPDLMDELKGRSAEHRP